jgi:hypothetical protein
MRDTRVIRDFIGKMQLKKLLLNEFEILWEFSPKDIYLHSRNGGLAQLARALAWHARGHRFDSDILHIDNQAFTNIVNAFFLSDKTVIKHKSVKNNIKFMFF